MAKVRSNWARRLEPTIAVAMIAVLIVAACKSSPVTTEIVPASTTSQPPDAQHEATAPLSTSTAETPSAPPPLPSLPRCKAVGQKQTVGIGVGPNELLQMHAENGFVYLLSYLDQMARVRWSRVSRSGGQLEKIAEVKRMGVPSELTARDGTAYYTQAGKLLKLGPEIGASQVLHQSAHSPPALHADQLFFVECDKKGTADYVKQISVAGGFAQTVAELAHPPGKSCEYPSIVADERDVMVGDWKGQRVVAVARQGGSQRTLIAKRGFPQSLMLEDDAVTFVSSRGVERIAREGGEPLRLLDNEQAAGPFSHAILRDGEYWVADWLAYTPTDHLFRLPYRGGTPLAVVSFTQSSPVDTSPSDDYLSGFAVDDECVYWARTRPGGTKAELFARAK